MVTEDQRYTAEKIAREIAEQLKKHGVASCNVDDNNQYGSFALLAYLDMQDKGRRGLYWPENKSTFNLKKIIPGIKRIIRDHRKDGVRFEYTESPPSKYSGYKDGPKSLDGYEKNYIYISLTVENIAPKSEIFPTSEYNPDQLSLKL